MRLVPTLWLGPRRVVRRPVESIILFLAVTLGTLGTVTAVDATVGLLKTSAEGASKPGLRRVSVFARLDVPRAAVFPKALWNQALERYHRFPQDTTWIDQVGPWLPPLETSYVRYASWAKVRVEGPWIDVPRSLCASGGLFSLSEVEMVAGRAFTAEEWKAGARVVVVGTGVLGRLFPGLSPDQALGRSFEVKPVGDYGDPISITIAGVCRQRPGVALGSLGTADEWVAITKLPGIRPEYGSGLEFVFHTRTAAEVPGLLAALRPLLDKDPALKGQTLDSPYEEYRKMQVVYTGIVLVILAVGGGTFLIALWTLGSVFRSRVPSMARSLRLLRALGADRRTLLFLGLSEILPVALGGLAVGIALALALRHALTPELWFQGYDGALLGGLAVFALGFQLYHVFPLLTSGTPQGGRS